MNAPETRDAALRPPPWGLKEPRRLARLCVCILPLGLPAAAVAQEAASSQDLWRAVLSHPADLELGYRYTQALIGAGRYDDAAAQLERMLIIEPDQPRLRLELGALYLRLGNYVLARSYLRRAFEAPGLTPAVRERLQSYIEEVDRRTNRSQINGSVSLGGRYQTNANGGVARDAIAAATGGVGLPALLPRNLRKRGDVNAFIDGGLTHTYDLQLQREAAVVTSLGAYATRQTSADFYNVAGLTLRSGVRFAVAPASIPTLSAYPYVLTDLLFLNDRFFNLAGGLGLQVSFAPVRKLVITLIGEGRAAHYDNVPRLPQSSLLTGNDKLGAVQATYRVSPETAVFGQMAGRVVNTRQAFFDFDEIGLTLGLSSSYRAPITFLDLGKWNAAVSASYLWRYYGSPDPTVDSTRTLREREWSVGVRNQIPISSRWSLFQYVEYRNINANIANYTRDNLSVSVGVTAGF